MSGASVFVALGTDHHVFDRLVEWVQRLADENSGTEWFVQHGHTGLPPALVGSPMLSEEELKGRLESARAVVTHGGPGLILESRAQGHTPVVVPRQPELNEHVDGHQLLFTARLAQAGLIRRALTFDDFRAAVETALATGPVPVAANAQAGEGVDNFEHLVGALLARRGARRPWWTLPVVRGRTSTAGRRRSSGNPT